METPVSRMRLGNQWQQHLKPAQQDLQERSPLHSVLHKWVSGYLLSPPPSDEAKNRRGEWNAYFEPCNKVMSSQLEDSISCNRSPTNLAKSFERKNEQAVSGAETNKQTLKALAFNTSTSEYCPILLLKVINTLLRPRAKSWPLYASEAERAVVVLEKLARLFQLPCWLPEGSTCFAAQSQQDPH